MLGFVTILLQESFSQYENSAWIRRMTINFPLLKKKENLVVSYDEGCSYTDGKFDS